MVQSKARNFERVCPSSWALLRHSCLFVLTGARGTVGTVQRDALVDLFVQRVVNWVNPV